MIDFSDGEVRVVQRHESHTDQAVVRGGELGHGAVVGSCGSVAQVELGQHQADARRVLSDDAPQEVRDVLADEGRALADATPTDLAAAGIEGFDVNLLGPEAVVESKRAQGGTSRAAVSDQLEAAKAEVEGS